MYAYRQTQRERELLQTELSSDHQVKRRQPNQRARRAPPDSYCSWEEGKKKKKPRRFSGRSLPTSAPLPLLSEAAWKLRGGEAAELGFPERGRMV